MRCLKIFIYHLELWGSFCLAERNHLCTFGRRHHEEQFCVIHFKFGIQEMSFKDISYLELWWPLCSAEQKPFVQFW